MTARLASRSRGLRWRVAALAGAWLFAGAACAQPGDDAVVQAREAFRQKDRAALASLRNGTAQHPLAAWVEYWELTNRLSEARVDEVEAFYARWSGAYVEDRLRNDWLLELGKRRDWVNFARDHPRFRMNDDREVACYALLTQHLAGQPVREQARAAWHTQKDLDDGCNLLAATLFAAGELSEGDVWREARLSIEFNRPRAARAAAALLGAPVSQAVGELLDNPAKYLARRGAPASAAQAELAALALLKMALAEPEVAAELLRSRWQRALPPELAAQAWAVVGKQTAMKLSGDAPSHYQQAWTLVSTPPRETGWTDETLAWQVRSALRSARRADDRWSLVSLGIDAMSPAEQKDPAWVYWKARALRGLARAGADGDAQRLAAQQLLDSIAGQMNFYGKLATEELGGRIALPAAPAPLTAAEQEAARKRPGLLRAMHLIGLGLRGEGVREWNFTLRGLADRELLAAAQFACEHELWDRCINTSDRTKAEVDMAQRFPTPFRQDVVAKAREIGLDPAYVYGLIRQESRFVMDARSSAGASGLMQLMPATARWTAKKIGLDYRPEMIADRDVNLRLGTSYLKLVLDDFGGSQALAAAAYNAGPNRPRRWREGPLLEPAAWAENIPFGETRDYVKKVLSNAVYYSALLTGQVPSLKSRLGALIGPRDASAPVPDREIP